jgi:hypothetical protein
MADLRSVGTAIEEYSIDNNFYPVADDVAELETSVSPSYIRKLPERDGWGTDLAVQSTANEYTLGSCGKGATSCDGGSLTLSGTGGKTVTFAADIIFSNGSFVQWPEGKQD